jgi:DNA-directed RNA polymerase beta subunit
MAPGTSYVYRGRTRHNHADVCNICGDKTVISKMECSYAFKLLIQEMMALGLAPRLRLDEKA